MNLTTYPVNSKNPGSLVPISFGILFAQIQDNEFTILVDKNERAKRVDNFDLAEHLKLSYLPQTHIGFEKIQAESVPPEMFEDLSNMQIRHGEWLRCPCGKVEIYDLASLNFHPTQGLKLATNSMECVLCSGKLEKRESLGLIVKIPNISLPDSEIEEMVQPLAARKEALNLYRKTEGSEILISRTRDTGYTYLHNDHIFNIDPTIFNLLYALRRAQSSASHLVAGREGILSFALTLALTGTSVPHIILPRFSINDWNEFLSIPLEELSILVGSSISWKRNTAEIQTADLKFIRRHIREIQARISASQTERWQDTLSRNLLNLKNS